MEQDRYEARSLSTTELRRREQEALESNFVYRLAELREENAALRKENQTLKNRETAVNARLAEQARDKQLVRVSRAAQAEAEKRADLAEGKLAAREADLQALEERIDSSASKVAVAAREIIQAAKTV